MFSAEVHAGLRAIKKTAKNGGFFYSAKLKIRN